MLTYLFVRCAFISLKSYYLPQTPSFQKAVGVISALSAGLEKFTYPILYAKIYLALDAYYSPHISSF